MEFEAILATFDKKSDEYKAFESLIKANDMSKAIEKGKMYSEEELRLLMNMYLDAFWIYEKLRGDLSNNIHSIGAFLEQKYECQYFFDANQQKYFHECPAMLLHHDIGFSMRGSEKYKCSICGLPIMECEHISEEYYDDVICKVIDGNCNICGEHNCKKHIVGIKYNQVLATKIVYDVNLVTFDIVEDPEMKFARIKKVYLSEEDVKNGLGEDDRDLFIYGVSILYCHHCSQCQGYTPQRFHHLFAKDSLPNS